jgi:PAS domain S-box-containing protein
MPKIAATMIDSDSFYQSPDFQRYFEGAKRSLVLKADAPVFTVLAASDLYLELTHKKREEVIGRGLFEVYPGNHADPTEKNSVFSSFMRVIESGKPDELPLFKYEIALEASGLKETHYWTNVNEPILDPHGGVAYVINTTTNITDKIRQEQALAESEDRFRLMAEGTNVMIAVGDHTGRAIYFNKSWEEATGRTVAELLEFGWIDLIHPEDKNGVREVYNDAFEKREAWSREFRMPAKSGHYRWLLVHGVPRFTKDGGFAGYISSSVDITAQKAQQFQLATLNKDLLTANMELAESERILAETNSRLQEREYLLKLSIQTSGMGTWIADLQERKVALSERTKAIKGIKGENDITLRQLTDIINPSDRQRFLNAIGKAVAHDETFIIEYRINTPDEHGERWLRTSGIVHSNGKYKNVLGTVLDITEQKLNEQRKNDFISMVSHELKTPLTSANGYVQISRAKVEELGDTFTSALLNKASNQIAKMTALINSFLNVSRFESAKIYIQPSSFDMAELMSEVEEEAVTSITSHQVLFAPVKQTFLVADRDKIGQVINNLISNAVKYSPQRSTIQVTCTTNSGWVTVSVKDEGIGISAENLPKLFDRYYRVDTGLLGVPGFGIGLYLCYEIIQLHHGKIWAESEVGRGSTFYFMLPLSP